MRTIVLAVSTLAFAVSLVTPKAFADVLPFCSGAGTSQAYSQTFTKAFATENCSLLMWGYVYERQVVKTTYNNGVTYFCTNWQFNGNCGFGGSTGSLPACPSSTCSTSMILGN